MEKQAKKKILIIIGAYLPGYKVGGPGVSIANLVEALGDEYDFRIMCADHDLGESEPYKGVVPYKWTKVGKAKVFYVPKFTAKVTLKLCRSVDLVYMCGCFNDYARQVLRAKSKRKFDAPVVIAAMGLFAPGAYRMSGLKKRIYMALTRLAGYYDEVSWSATTREEAGDVARALHCDISELPYHVAKDLPRVSLIDGTGNPKTDGAGKPKKDGTGKSKKAGADKLKNDVTDSLKKRRKEKNTLSVIFLSRISPEKNLSAVAQIIAAAGGDISLEVYGPAEDKEYFEECKRKLDESSVSWRYHGPVRSDDVFKAFSKSDVFLFPTLGENFGHVISEALCTGCPVITSDRTPWNDLSEHGAGFSLGIPDSDEDCHEWADALNHYAEMSADEMSKVSENCISYIRSKIDIDSLKAAYRDMFEDEMEG